MKRRADDQERGVPNFCVETVTCPRSLHRKYKSMCTRLPRIVGQTLVERSGALEMSEPWARR